jgi:diacylglycerol kinase family enzyme
MIGVIVNPNARGVARDRALAVRLGELLDGDGRLIETSSPAEVERAVGTLLDGGCDLIAACGGDGTNLTTLTAATRLCGERPLPRFALLRGGTVNTVAANLGVDGRPEEILRRIVERRRDGLPPIEHGQDTVRVIADGGAPQVGFLFAAAMGARFLESYYSGPIAGPAWATMLAARVVGSAFLGGRFARRLFDPIEVALEADGERVPIDRVRLLLASVVPSVGIGMKVTWRGGGQPNRFHLVASGLPLRAMALQLERVLAGRPLEGQPHVDRLARSLRARFAEEQPYTLDGELDRAHEVAIEMGPRVWIVHG